MQRLAGQALLDAGVRPEEVLAVGITNQRETVCAWDADTGEPLHSAIVWQDRRTADRCAELRERGLQPLIRQRTGLVLDPYFSATKMQWLLRNVAGLAQMAAEGRALLGTVDSWLAFKLTGEHVTDASNAARTLLYDISAGDWDPSCWRSSVCRGGRCRRSTTAPVRSRLCGRARWGGQRRLPGSRATSSLRSSARPVWTPEWARAPTAPAPSCC